MTTSKAGCACPGQSPRGADLEAVDNKLKTLKLTIRNAPLQQPAEFAPCLFSGKPGVEEILIGRAY